MSKENEPKTKFETGQIVRGRRVVGVWLLTKDGLFIGSGDDVRKVEPEEKINFQSLKGFPINESRTPDDS